MVRIGRIHGGNQTTQQVDRCAVCRAALDDATAGIRPERGDGRRREAERHGRTSLGAPGTEYAMGSTGGSRPGNQAPSGTKQQPSAATRDEAAALSRQDGETLGKKANGEEVL